MPLAGIVIGKYQNLIIGGIYFLVYVLIAFITNNEFLKSNIIWTLSVFGGFSVCMFLFMRIVEITIKKQDRLTSKVILQNRELFTQSNNLEEINKLLNQQTIEIKNQQKELQKLNSTKDKLFSLIAHDLKTPMNSIIGLLEIIEIKFDSMPEEKKKHYLKLVKAASINTFALLENLLEWSISQTKTISCNPTKLLVSDLFKQIADLLSPAARNKKIELNIVLKDSLEIIADEHMIFTVLRNLVSNGIKYTPENGKVTLIAESIENTAKISVSDTGIGIPKEKIDLLFRIDSTSSTKGTSGESGTGLGLIISNDFLTKHSSQLHIKSSINQGTTFYFTLPFAV
jgi:signal transduction histidine kinase